MTIEENLIEKLKSPEDRFVERKQNASKDEICKTLVAFANSLPEFSEGYLFVGVADSGEIKGVDNPDETQKKIRNWAEEVCYPTIKIQCQCIRQKEKDIIAVTIFSSENRPHFAGNAYVRIGSESKKASSEMFEELITSRNSIAKRLLRAKDKKEQVIVSLPCPFDPKSSYRITCYVSECNPHYVRFKGDNSHENPSASINKISLNWEGQMDRLLIYISQ